MINGSLKYLIIYLFAIPESATDKPSSIANQVIITYLRTIPP